jgi:uncharacterized DUF497 family protein
MTSRDMARSHRRRAARVMREAERLFADEDWSLCVRRCQEDFVAFTVRRNRVRVISARPMSRRERAIHDGAKEARER